MNGRTTIGVSRCYQCKEELPADAVRCPSCGFNPRRYARWSGGLAMLVGGYAIATFTDVLFVLGVVLFLVGIVVLVSARSLTASTGSSRSEEV